MRTIERRHDIVQHTLKHGKVDVVQLAERYEVSAVTIRADLNYLAKKNLLVRTRGGAIASHRIQRELTIDEKHNAKTETKRRLAAVAKSLIAEGDALILDSGSTTAEIANSLGNFSHLVVMTNGLNVAKSLLQHDGIEVLMTGGILRKTSQSFYGRQAEDSIERYHFNKVILGVDGIDFNSGLTTHFEYEALLNRLMCNVVNTVIAVTDSSKFNRAGVHKICGLEDLDVLVTDSGIPDVFVQEVEKLGVKVLIA